MSDKNILESEKVQENEIQLSADEIAELAIQKFEKTKADKMAADAARASFRFWLRGPDGYCPVLYPSLVLRQFTFEQLPDEGVDAGTFRIETVDDQEIAIISWDEAARKRAAANALQDRISIRQQATLRQPTARKRKSEARGNTKSPYNFENRKKQRKLAKKSRRKNRR
jgi:hypothetical protein